MAALALFFGQDVSAALGDCLDQSFVSQCLNGAPRGVPGYSEQVDEVFLGGQGVFAGPELPGFDPGPQPRGDLPVGRQGATRVDLRHVHPVKLADQQRPSS